MPISAHTRASARVALLVAYSLVVAGACVAGGRQETQSEGWFIGAWSGRPAQVSAEDWANSSFHQRLELTPDQVAFSWRLPIVGEGSMEARWQVMSVDGETVDFEFMEGELKGVMWSLRRIAPGQMRLNEYLGTHPVHYTVFHRRPASEEASGIG